MRYDAVKVAAILGSVGMVFHLLMCVGWPAYYHNLDASTFEKSDVDSLGGPEWLLKASCENGLKPPTSVRRMPFSCYTSFKWIRFRFTMFIVLAKLNAFYTILTVTTNRHVTSLSRA